MHRTEHLTNITSNRKKRSRHGDLAPGICSPCSSHMNLLPTFREIPVYLQY